MIKHSRAILMAALSLVFGQACWAQSHSAQVEDGQVILLSKANFNNSDKFATNTAIQTALVGFMGYQAGNYREVNTPAVWQVLDALSRKRTQEEITLDDGQRMISSRAFEGKGEDRAALLIDSKGQLLAVALVHGVCLDDAERGEVICSQIPHAILTIFLGKGVSEKQVEPLISWGKTLPEDLEFDAKYLRKDGTTPDAWAVTQVNFVKPDVSKPGWSLEALPAKFPRVFAELMLPQAYIKTLTAEGVYVYPSVLAGSKSVEEDDHRYADASAGTATAGATLFRVGNLEDTLKAYQEFMPDAQVVKQNSDVAILEGDAHGFRYRIVMIANSSTGDYGLDNAIEVQVQGWMLE